MNDTDLLKRLPLESEPLDPVARDRIRALVVARTTGLQARALREQRRRRAVRMGVLAVAAVIAATAASVIANHPWTTDEPVAIPLDQGANANGFIDISDPNGVVNPALLPSTVAEFAPSIRLPEGGSYDEWINYATTNFRPEYSYETTRSTVVFKMATIAQCQWVQQWLTATDSSNGAKASEAIRVLPGISTWLRGAGEFDNGYFDSLVNQMRQGNVPQVQSFENGCPFTGSWGDTASEQDGKATGDLAPAIQIVRSYLNEGGDPEAFNWHAGDRMAHLIEWSDPDVQPGPIFPGLIYIAPTTADGVMLISPSESGTRFCAVISDDAVARGIVDPDRFPPDPTSLNSPWDNYPGPVSCTRGGWPS